MKPVFTILILLITCISHSTLAQEVAWTTVMGSKAADESFGICTDPVGNVVSVGLFKDTLDVTLIDGSAQRLISNGLSDIIVKKQNTDGGIMWVKSFGSVGDEFANAITSDDEGNVYFTGMFYEDIDFNPGGPNGGLRVSGTADLFVCKLNADGNFVWAKRIGGDLAILGFAIVSGYGIAVDKEENVYVTGNYMGSVTFKPGDTSTTKTSFAYDIFLLKLDANANYVWGHTFTNQTGPAMPDFSHAIDIDGDANVYITGFFYGDIDFDPGTGSNVLISTNPNVSDIFVAKYTTNGQHVWAFNLGSGIRPAVAFDVKLDGLGNMFISGDFGSTVDFNPGVGTNTLTKYGGDLDWDAFVLKLDTAANFKWAKQLGSTLGDIAYGVAPDRVGNVYVTGHVGSGGFILDKDTLDTYGRIDLFVSKLAADDGEMMWTNVWGGKDEEAGNSIAVDQSGNAFITGYYESTIKFNIDGKDESFTATGGKDILDFKIVCNDTSSYTIVDTACREYVINGITYVESGLYTQILAGKSGCDSVLTIDLNVIGDLNPQINIDGFILGTTNAYSGYQWLLDDEAIPEATDRYYEVKKNGFYRVVVTNERGCTDTSDAYEVNNVSSVNNVSKTNRIAIYPNPTNNIVYIKTDLPVTVAIKSVDGKTLIRTENTNHISLQSLASGMYYLVLTNEAGELIGMEKVIKK